MLKNGNGVKVVILVNIKEGIYLSDVKNIRIDGIKW